MTGVDIVTLRLLVALDDLGSINAAAQALDITQPAASARLRAFEARWRLPVAQRSPRGTTFTADGVAVISWARRVLRETEAMESGLRALAGAREGEFSVAASLTIAEFVLPQWLSQLQSRQPGSRPHLQVVNSTTVLDLVTSGRAGLGFIETATDPAGFEHRIIGYDTLVVAVRPDHAWARRSYPIPTAQLLEASYVVREPGSGTRGTFEKALRQVPRVAMEASSTQALVGAALAGIGPAVLSALAIQSHLETGELVAVRTELDLRRPLTAVWLRGRKLGGPASELLSIALTSAAVSATTTVREVESHW